MKKNQSGYILIYVIGILVFLGLAALGVAYMLRINAQLVLHDKESVQNEYILESAVQYALAQLVKGQAAGEAMKSLNPETASKIPLWKMGGGPYLMEIQGKDVVVAVEDAGDRPDLNALTKEEIQRIFRALGASAEDAVAWSDEIARAKERGGGAGFSSLDQVLSLTSIPFLYRYGTGRAEGYAEQVVAEPQPGLDRLVTVGTGIRTVNLNQAPIQVIGALANADSARVEKFDAARKAKALKLAEAVAILGETARPVLRESPSELYRIRALLAQPGRLYEATAIVRGEGNAFKIQSYRNTQSDNKQ